MDKQSLPSVEQFAAYIDGNLSQSEMQQFSQLAEHDGTLHQLLETSSIVDNTIDSFSESDLQLPLEIIGSDFELPTIPTEDISQLVTLTPESMDDMPVAAAACAEEDISMSSDVNPKEYSTLGGEVYDDTSHLMPEDDYFRSCDDLSSLYPDDL